ncbi:MAG TPA: hypothetical protein VI138_00290 [Candidatus Dormibacteraeota bacterium]
MRSSRVASAVLAATVMALLVSACGATPDRGSPGTATCVGSGSHVEVVVETGGGHVVDRCVAFPGRTIKGEAALRKSGIEYATEHFSYGDAVCQLDHDPTSYTACFATGQPYWALFLWSGGKWKSATTGIGQVILRSGQALGWRYDPSTGAAPPPPRPPRA